MELYYWPTPNGWKVSIFLEEAKIPYEVVYIDITKGDQFARNFLAISPNNRMPAIVDPTGPSNKPISVFESGAILQYLGEKTGKFYPKQFRRRTEVNEWVFWQMGGLGPMAGQAHHFRQYAPQFQPEKAIVYGAERYTNEVNRLYGVLDKRLKGRDFICGTYSIADMAIFPWILPWQNQGQEIDDFPNLKAWFERLRARPAVERGYRLGRERRENVTKEDQERARKILFNQRAR
ncbi:MAG: glutathione S-transferase N-terminal domain-containing protein [Pseudomonadota bacterium]